ncbi:MAG: serine/threonine protein kinase [Deltaproteobacteria bacterium]|nr:serine/threonine protein kinase [Deltaproteobacteria bacterium]
MDFAPGTAVNARLKLVRHLDSGAMGSVWVAHRAGTPQPVAVKFLAARPDREALVRFQREASAASRIDSPNVVRILEHGSTTDGTPFIVMELLEGETLGERLARVGRLGLDDTAAIVRQVAYALDAAHRLGIVHRDIKPDNIFLVGKDDFPLAKVLDFGMAKEKLGDEEPDVEVTRVGVAVGTPEYMSPEQVLGAKEVDGQSDLWSLGVLAYRALAGTSPFDSDSPHALVFAICRGAYRPLGEVGIAAAFEPWFQKALCPKKPGRYESARQMVDDFDRVFAEVATSETDSTVPTTSNDDDDEDEDGATSFFSSSLPPASSGPAISVTEPSLRPAAMVSEDSAITAKPKRGEAPLKSIAREDEHAASVGWTQLSSSSDIEQLIAKSVRGAELQRAPAREDVDLFAPESLRGLATTSIVDDLASLEETRILNGPALFPPPEELVRTVPDVAEPPPELLSLLEQAAGDGVRTIPLVDPDSREVGARKRRGPLVVVVLLLVVVAAAWLRTRG